VGRLSTRMRDLERRRPRPSICPEHAMAPPHRDYRAGLAPFLPPEMPAELPAPEAGPPCDRCGFRWEPGFEVNARTTWAQP